MEGGESALLAEDLELVDDLVSSVVSCAGESLRVPASWKVSHRLEFDLVSI